MERVVEKPMIGRACDEVRPGYRKHAVLPDCQRRRDRCGAHTPPTDGCRPAFRLTCAARCRRQDPPRPSIVGN
nr:hypothetical protein [Mycobacterium ostraviense]